MGLYRLAIHDPGDLKIGGRVRQVLMQAPKNGFFYVLDRATGELLSAKAFIPLNWASGVDLRSGRPIENPAARYSETDKPWPAMPGPLGAHSWYPMSFSPQTGLVYLPAQEAGTVYVPDNGFALHRTGWNLGADLAAHALPSDPKVVAAIRATLKGYLLAWDPVRQREVWRADHGEAFNGGTLATAGNLVFQGGADGQVAAYRADTGTKLWHFDAQTPVMAPPISYWAGGVQYVAVMAGYGGVSGMGPGELTNPDLRKRNISRLLVFRLNGDAALPPPPPPIVPQRPSPPDEHFPAGQIEAGRELFGRSCSTCHGADAVSAGLVPDLRHSASLGRAAFGLIVSKGVLSGQGMVSFADTLGPAQIEAVRAYLVTRAHETAVAYDKGAR